jgi:hypothetical protein
MFNSKFYLHMIGTKSLKIFLSQMKQYFFFFWVAAILVGRSERGNKRYKVLGTNPKPLNDIVDLTKF